MNKLRGPIHDSIANRRTHARFVLLPSAAVIVMPGLSGRQQVYRAELANISESGLAVTVTAEEAEALPPGQAARVRFALGDDVPFSRISARVVHRSFLAKSNRAMVGLVWDDAESGEDVQRGIRTFLSETAESTAEVA